MATPRFMNINEAAFSIVRAVNRHREAAVMTSSGRFKSRQVKSGKTQHNPDTYMSGIWRKCHWFVLCFSRRAHGRLHWISITTEDGEVSWFHPIIIIHISCAWSLWCCFSVIFEKDVCSFCLLWDGSVLCQHHCPTLSQDKSHACKQNKRCWNWASPLVLKHRFHCI